MAVTKTFTNAAAHRQALAIYVTLCLIRTEVRPHNFGRSPVTALASYLNANGRAVIAGTLQAASTSAIMSDRSSWLRLPPLMPPAASMHRFLGTEVRHRSVPNLLQLCSCYFRLEHIVFSDPLA